MKKIVYVFVLLHAVAAFSQKEANIWQFGVEAGLDFNSGVPVPLFGSQIFTNEGSSSIADEEGNLLFYTDGVTVYNKNHQVMQNGTGLMGHTSCTQSTLIVGRPGSDTAYYIFTVGAVEDPNGLNYSEVDMTANDGLGAVTAVKNINLLNNTTEGITATLHANGEDIWLVAHLVPGDSLFSFLITEEGISLTPVVSNAGPVLLMDFDLDMDEVGSLKISPGGNRVAMASQGKGTVVFDYDKATGIVSNALQIEPDTDKPYSLEFSPNGNVLYTSRPERITQYNLLAADIAGSGIVVFEDVYCMIGAMQLASNGRIYKAEPLQDFLTVINNPDVLGMGCGVQFMSVFLGGSGYCGLGLPTAITSYFVKPDFTVTGQCFTAQTQFTFNWNRNPDTILWDFGDGNTSTALNPVYNYNSPGTYTVVLTVTKSGSSWVTQQDITITAPPEFTLAGPFTACTTTGMVLGPDTFNFNLAEAGYLWEFNGQPVGNAATLQPEGFGTYSLTITLNGCSATQSTTVTQQTIAATFFEGCEANGYTLSAAPREGSFNAATASYSWQMPGGFTAQGPQAMADEAGDYILTITSAEGCVLTYTYVVADVFCGKPLIPKGVSPNGDGKNDAFDLSLHNVLQLNIYNRYGLEVYTRANYTTQWHGQTNSGGILPDGAYYYRILKHDGSNATGWVYVNRNNE